MSAIAEKDLKTLAKEAKQRLKTGFWQKHKEEVIKSTDSARQEGIAESVVIDYYQSIDLPSKKTRSTVCFYDKVRQILDEKGQVSNILSLLVDHEEYDFLSYDNKQKYMLELSSKYLEALDRYNAEKKFKR